MSSAEPQTPLQRRFDSPVPSECGHSQMRPSNEEIERCPEVVVRECPICKRPLWWSVSRWRCV